MIKRPLISLICLLTMLSGVGLLSGCGPSKATASIPGATTTPVATATPATTTYTSSDGQYSLKYPTGWMVKVLADSNTANIVQLGDTGGNHQLLVEELLTVQVASYKYPALLMDVLSDPANFKNTKVASTTSTASYPSGTWAVASATTLLLGEPYVVRLYGIAHSGHTVIIVTLAPSSSATTDQTTYFAPMFTSFTFLK